MKGRYIFFALLTGVVLIALSTPYYIETIYWAESLIAWIFYWLIGSIAAVVILYMFLRIQHVILMGGKEENTYYE